MNFPPLSALRIDERDAQRQASDCQQFLRAIASRLDDGEFIESAFFAHDHRQNQIGYHDKDNLEGQVGVFAQLNGYGVQYLVPNPLRSLGGAPLSNTRGSFTRRAGDADVARIIWYFIDCDPCYQKIPDGKKRDGSPKFKKYPHPANPTEIVAVYDVYQKLMATLFGAGVSAENWIGLGSGNGFQALVACDLPNTVEVREGKRNLTKLLSKSLSTPEVDVDMGVYNAARLTKIAGTLNAKKIEKPEEGRIWRASKLLHCPAEIVPFDFSELFAESTEICHNYEEDKQRQARIENITTGQERKTLSESDLVEGWDRPLPKIPSFSSLRLPKGETCAVCGQHNSQCLKGRDADGNGFTLCWSPESWWGSEGIDYIIHHTFGDVGSAFYWDDETKFVGSVVLGDFYLLEGSRKSESATVEEVEEKETEPESFGVDNLREGALKDLCNYFRQHYFLKYDDAPAIGNALMLISVMSNNKFKWIDGYEKTFKLNLWLLQVGMSGIGKSSLGNEIKDIYDRVSEEGVHLPSQDKISESALIELIQEAPHKTVMFRADEYKRFRTDNLLSSAMSFFMECYLGHRAASAFKNNKEKKDDSIEREVKNFHFCLLSQTTPDNLFDDDDPRHNETLLSGGWFGRFLTILDTDNDIYRMNRFTARGEREIMERIVGRKYTKNQIFAVAKTLYENINSHFDGELLSFSEAVREQIHDYECHLLGRKTALKFDPTDANHVALINRLLPQIKRVAAIIELSHMPYSSKGRAGAATIGDFIPHPVSIESYREAFYFIVTQAAKWFEYIKKALGATKSERVASCLEIALRDWDQWEEIRSTNGQTVLAVKRSIIWQRIRGKVRDAQHMDMAIRELVASDMIEEIEVSTKGRKAHYLAIKDKS